MYFNEKRFLSEMVVKGFITTTFVNLSQEVQNNIVNVLYKEAGERGPDSLNIKIIAAKSGVSVGSMYQYFGSRDNLISFAVELCVEEFTSLLKESEEYFLSLPFKDALEQYMEYGLKMNDEQRGLYLFLAGAVYKGDGKFSKQVVTPIAEALKGLIRKIVEKGAAEGEIRDDIPVSTIVSIINMFLLSAGDSIILPGLNDYFLYAGDEKEFKENIKGFLTLFAPLKGL